MTAVPRAYFIGDHLDGYIARSDGGLDWLARRRGTGDSGYESFMASTCVIRPRDLRRV